MYICIFATMKHLSTYLPPFFYAALTTISVVLYISNGALNGDFLYGFERFSMLNDEPLPAELPNIRDKFARLFHVRWEFSCMANLQAEVLANLFISYITNHSA